MATLLLPEALLKPLFKALVRTLTPPRSLIVLVFATLVAGRAQAEAASDSPSIAAPGVGKWNCGNKKTFQPKRRERLNKPRSLHP